MKKIYNIGILDDHPMVREGLRAALSELTTVRVKSLFNNGTDLLQYSNLKDLDIILLDVFLPDINGIDLCLKIKKLYPSIIVIGMSSQAERGIVTQMLKNGARGYLLKSASLDEFKQGVLEAVGGRTVFCKEVHKIVYKTSVRDLFPVPRLTRREREILSLLKLGKSTQEISETLFLSYLTVQTHRRNLLNKFGLKNTIEVLNFCKENGLL